MNVINCSGTISDAQEQYIEVVTRENKRGAEYDTEEKRYNDVSQLSVSLQINFDNVEDALAELAKIKKRYAKKKEGT